MQIINNRVLISVQQNETKKITRNDGVEIELITRLDYKSGTASDVEISKDRGVVIEVAENSCLKKGDFVYFDRAIVNNETMLVDRRGGEIIVWANDATTYHRRDVYTFNKKGRKTYTFKRGEIKDETQIYAVERDGVLRGYNTWYLFRLDNVEFKQEESGVFVQRDEFNILECVAESINPPSDYNSLLGKRCLIKTDGDLIMYIEIKIGDSTYAVASIEDVIAIVD